MRLGEPRNHSIEINGGLTYRSITPSGPKSAAALTWEEGRNGRILINFQLNETDNGYHVFP